MAFIKNYCIFNLRYGLLFRIPTGMEKHVKGKWQRTPLIFSMRFYAIYAAIKGLLNREL